MKRKFMFLLSMAFPWLVLFINDDLVGAFIALLMQLTIIGWIPASIWAWKVEKKSLKYQNASAQNPTPNSNSESRDVK